MTTTTTATLSGSSGPVVGDGTTATGRARSRWRRSRLPLAILVLVVVGGLLAALPTPHTSGVPLAPDNPSALGARAVAQILGDQGIDVHHVRTTRAAVAGASAGTTLLVTSDYLLDDDQLDALAATRADLVLIDPSAYTLSLLTNGRADRDWGGTAGDATLTSQCTDPDAVAAERITVRDNGLRLAGTDGSGGTDGDGTVCFPGEDPMSGAYLVVDGDRRVTALASSSPLTNEHLSEEGNAALVLRMLGRHTTLTWYVPSANDAGTGAGSGAAGVFDLLPPSAPLVGLQLLVVALLAALWRGRRLGRLVTEPLPVVVRASEAVRGRGRLYRRSRSYGHAAAALRAGTARRCAARVGLARSARAEAVIDALARATGRRTDDVAGLLYGPPPTDDTGLASLARALDELESEVHRT